MISSSVNLAPPDQGEIAPPARPPVARIQSLAPRIQSIDALRGLIMIIMALDHVRDFYSREAMVFLPEDLSRTTAALFLTRWVTHICAPVFMFTAGIGAYFYWQGHGRDKGKLSKFLWTRGLWLILLELTVLRFLITFSPFQGALLLTILWALGCSMIFLAALVYLPVRALAIVSVLMIALHNLADSLSAAQFGSAAWVWNVLHQQGAFTWHGVTFI